MSADDFKEWPMDLSPVQVDDDGRLFISPVIHNWNIVTERGINTVVDLEESSPFLVETLHGS